MNLNKLNKDLLVKLIETLQKDLQKENENLRKLLEEYQNITYKYNCCYLNCKAYIICAEELSRNHNPYGPQIAYINCDSFKRCYNCHHLFCDVHISPESFCSKCFN